MKFFATVLLLIPSIAISASQSIFDNHSWFFDKSAVTTKYNGPVVMDGKTFGYSIEYTTPDGLSGKSDLCARLSDNSLSCLSGDSLTYDAAAQSVTLKTMFTKSYTYYEKDSQPQGSALSGTWKHVSTQLSNCNDPMTTRLVIPYHKKDATMFENVEKYSRDGYNKGNTYYLIKDHDTGRLVLSYDANKTYFYGAYYLYDANNNPITDISQITSGVKLNDIRFKFDINCMWEKESAS